MDVDVEDNLPAAGLPPLSSFRQKGVDTTSGQKKVSFQTSGGSEMVIDAELLAAEKHTQYPLHQVGSYNANGSSNEWESVSDNLENLHTYDSLDRFQEGKAV